MNLILILVKNYIISSKKDFLSLLFYFFSFPILLYLFLVIPFNSLFENLTADSSLTFRPTYLYQSFASIVYVSCSFIAFFIPLLYRFKMRNNLEYNEYILSTGITDIIHDFSIILWSIICAFIQYIISLIVFLQYILFVVFRQRTQYNVILSKCKEYLEGADRHRSQNI